MNDMERSTNRGDTTTGLLSGFKVELAPFSAEWAGRFEKEKLLLLRVLSPFSHQIEHIGSTAVQGAMAKPIVDIAVRLDNLHILSQLVEPLADLGYEYLEEFGLPGRHFFIKGRPRSFHLHVVDHTNAHWEKWIKFRNILRANRHVLEMYLRLKDDLAKKYADQREKYTQAKSEFINSVLAGHSG